MVRIGETPDWSTNQARIQFFWRGRGTEKGNSTMGRCCKGDMQNRQKAFSMQEMEAGKRWEKRACVCSLVGGASRQDRF